MMKTNKKGAEKIMSIYWFAILLIVAGGIFAMVYTFYGHPIDVRGTEARLLTNAIADCVSVGSRTNAIVFSSDFEDKFMEYCKLNFNDTGWDSTQYSVQLELESNGVSLVNIVKGNLNIISDCGINGEKISSCYFDEFYSLNPNGNLDLIKINSIVRKTEKNAK